MSDSQKIDPLDDPRLTAAALGEIASGDLALDDEAAREVAEIARFAESLGAALRTDEAGLDSGRRAAILAASMASAKRAPVLPAPRGRVLRRVVQWSAGGAVAAGLALTVLPPILEARKHGNEAAAIGALRTTNSAETLFREGDKEQNGNLDYGDIAQLSATTLIDGVLGAAKRQGYTFALQPSTGSGELLYFANANPAALTSTGDRYFATNHAGVIYYDLTRPIELRTTRNLEQDMVFSQPGMTAVPPFGRAVPDETVQFEYFDTAVLLPANERLEQILSQEYAEGRLAREEVDRLRALSVRALNDAQREIDDLRREKNDLQDADVEARRAELVRRYRSKLGKEPVPPLPGLGGPPGPEELPAFVRLNALSGPTSAPPGDLAAYGIELRNGSTANGLVTNGFFPTPLKDALKEPQSTFSVDVDTASYARVRRSIQVQNAWPAAGTVRVEELVNYHEYGYPAPTDGRPIAASSEVTACPWAPGRRLVRIGLRGRGLEGQARRAANLVFLIDVSGSMASVEKLPLVQRALTLLTAQLGAQDRVSIVVYAGASGCVLDGASGADKAAILSALERLQSGGSTNGGAGIELAYALASRRFVEGGVNRVILCTDGDWNVGTTNTQALEALIAEKAKGHVSLTALGFGMSEGGDRTLETLAGRGDGNYAYIDGLPEARRVLVEQLDGTLVTIGKDVKVQVEWDPTRVTGYTLVGYEDRRLANADFANDAKDAGDVGARHAVTALYEVTTKPGARDLGTLRLRWKGVKGGVAEATSELLELPLTDEGKTLEQASSDTRFAAGVAAFALGLRAGPGAGRPLLDVAQALADGARGADPHGLRADLSALVRTARGLGGAPAPIPPSAQAPASTPTTVLPVGR